MDIAFLGCKILRIIKNINIKNSIEAFNFNNYNSILLIKYLISQKKKKKKKLKKGE